MAIESNAERYRRKNFDEPVITDEQTESELKKID